jgi:hypothetical protein
MFFIPVIALLIILSEKESLPERIPFVSVPYIEKTDDPGESDRRRENAAKESACVIPTMLPSLKMTTRPNGWANPEKVTAAGNGSVGKEREELTRPPPGTVGVEDGTSVIIEGKYSKPDSS